MQSCIKRDLGEGRGERVTILLFYLVLGLLLLGGLFAYSLQGKPRLSLRVGFSFAVGSAVAGTVLGIIILLTGDTVYTGAGFASLPGMNRAFLIDPLAAFFILVISLVSLAVSIFSFGYAEEYIGRHNLGMLGLLYNVFLLAMVALVASGNAFFFLFFWELMSLASYGLVVYDHRDSHVRRAGFVYIVMTHIGTLFIFLAFLLLYQTAGSFDFEHMAQFGRQLPSGFKTGIFLLVTVGFGTKAGIIPLHIWLPKAHPAAPSNVSALMSGVMLKTAIYGFIRVVMDVLGGGSAWWGILILSLGAVSALLGVMYALMQHDIKELLAYHSVENIGIILMGLGAALIFQGYGLPVLAMIGLTAALFHVLNHALFKALLFMGAGAIHHATRTRDMEKMGGLLKLMPWTGFFFLVGSISIAALPPFNGFVSEWLTFQSLLVLGSAPLSLKLNILGPVFGGALALTGALAAACFVKAFGIQFLAQPRSTQAANAKEVPRSMLVGMGILAVLCLVLGIFPSSAIQLLNPVTLHLVGYGSIQALGGYAWLNPQIPLLPNLSYHTMIAPFVLFVVLALGALLVYRVVKRLGHGGTRIDETWNCGGTLSPKMEYTATSFAKPIRIIFRRILLPKRVVKTEYALGSHFTRSLKYEGAVKPFFEDILYRPARNVFLKVSGKMRLLQSGSIHLYLGYLFITLVVLLIWAR